MIKPLSLLLLSISLSYTSDTLSLATINLNYKNKNNPTAIEDILKNKPDVIALIEWTGDNLYRKSIKKNTYKFDLDHPLYNGTHGIGIISKDSLAVTAKLVNSPVAGPCRIPFGLAEIKINTRKIAVFCCHVPPPVKGCRKTTDTTIGAIALWIKGGCIQRNKSISGIEMPVILLGDMNAPTWNSEIKKLKGRGLKDVLDAKTGLTNTWSPLPGMPKLIRIDYLMVPEQVEVIDSRTFNVAGSDHKGIFARIRFK